MNIDERIRDLEARFENIGKTMGKLVRSEFEEKFKSPIQDSTLFGLFTAMCVDTIDPWKQNRVRFFSPFLHNPNAPVKSLPFANSVSAMGGFDDCGLNWVPPAGSTLGIIFEHGFRGAPYYLGTIWHRNRGPEGEHNWNFNIKEYYEIHEGHRKGYLTGSNTGSQVLPPWNTESYNGNDIDSLVDFELDPDAQKRITFPNIYGFKTPQKHMVKMVDGDYKCNHRSKRLELQSSGGHHLIMKDDHIHDCSAYTHTSCGAEGPQLDCVDDEGNPIELDLTCDGESSDSTILGGHPSTSTNPTSNQGSNPFFKHENECRPYKGPGTPQNNKCELPQSGIQILSTSGHSFGMDDSVEEPSGIPNWERSTEPFDFGCNDKYVGRTFWVSATGHRIEMSDIESDSQLRGEENYIRILSASGNKIELNDHTTGQADCPGSPPNVAGSKRGITLTSTSNHVIQMIDEDNEQSGPCRKEGGEPINKSTKAFISIRSGYGLEISLNDFQRESSIEAPGSQEETINQNIEIIAPQKDNELRGPHIIRLQEKPDGPGQIFVRAGGTFVCSTYDDHLTIVGDKEDNPANKLTFVSKNKINITTDFYWHKADRIALQADKIILLMAGLDCPTPTGELAPCVLPVLVLGPKGIQISDRVFASASPSAGCASIFHLTPFHDC